MKRLIGGILLAGVSSIYLIATLIDWSNYTSEGAIIKICELVVLYGVSGFLIYSGIKSLREK